MAFGPNSARQVFIVRLYLGMQKYMLLLVWSKQKTGKFFSFFFLKQLDLAKLPFIFFRLLIPIHRNINIKN